MGGRVFFAFAFAGNRCAILRPVDRFFFPPLFFLSTRSEKRAFASGRSVRSGFQVGSRRREPRIPGSANISVPQPAGTVRPVGAGVACDAAPKGRFKALLSLWPSLYPFGGLGSEIFGVPAPC